MTALHPLAMPPIAVRASLALCALLPALGTSIANVALPTLAVSFGVSFEAVQWVVLAYLLGTTALVVGAGRLGDLMGRRRVLVAGIAVFTAGSALCTAAPTLGVLVAARALQGAGAAVLAALAMALVGDTVPKARTGRMMGLLGTLSAVGTAAGPAVGGLLLGALGWRAVFAVQVAAGLATLWLARRSLPADRPQAGPPFDTLGTVLLAAALTSGAWVVTSAHGAWDGRHAAATAAALAVTTLLARRQTLVPFPLLRFHRPGDPVLREGLQTGALVAVVMMTTLVVGPFHLTGALGLGPMGVGFAMALGPAVAAVTGLPAGRAVDRFGARPVAAAALGAMAAGCTGVAAAPIAWGVAGYLVPMAVLTAGFALFQAANHTGVMADVQAGERGAVSGLLNLARQVGFIVGASAMGALFAAVAGGAASPDSLPGAIARGTQVVFATGAGLMALAGLLRRCSAPRARPA